MSNENITEFTGEKFVVITGPKISNWRQKYLWIIIIWVFFSLQRSGPLGSHFMETSAVSWWPSLCVWPSTWWQVTWVRRFVDCMLEKSWFWSCVQSLTLDLSFNFQQTVLGMNRSCSLYCVLSGGFLSCYFTPEEIDAKVEPTFRVPVTKVRQKWSNVLIKKKKTDTCLWRKLCVWILQNTHICVLEKEWAGQRSRSLSITSPSAGGSESHVFSTGSGEELDDWLEAFHQHLFDQGLCQSSRLLCI